MWVTQLSELIEVYKSVSPAQLDLIAASGWCRFSAEGPQQRYFYPKVYRSYAEQIARQWDAYHHGVGYVVSAKLPREFLDRFPTQTVAYELHKEYKLPIDDLELFNRYIVGNIKAVSVYTRQKKAPPRIQRSAAAA